MNGVSSCELRLSFKRADAPPEHVLVPLRSDDGPMEALRQQLTNFDESDLGTGLDVVEVRALLRSQSR